MAGIGIQEILSTAFGGVLKMLSGKKYPQNVRALGMLVDDLQEALNAIAAQSRTSKLWLDCLIKSVFKILQYTRAERESDWPLHIVMVNKIILLFFTVRHYHYARYTLYYVRSINA